MIARLSILSLAASTFALAGDCDLPKNAPASAANKRQMAIDASVREMENRETAASTIYFVFPTASGKDSEIVPLSLPEGYQFQVPNDLAKRIAHAKANGVSVQLHNPSNSGLLYFIPYSVEGETSVKSFNPKADCPQAVADNRAFHKGCSTLEASLRGMETLTILYDQAAARCEEIAVLESKSGELSAEESELLAASINNLNKKFGAISGVNRSPSNLSAPTFADEKVDSRTQKGLEPGHTGRRRMPPVHPRTRIGNKAN